MRARIFPFPSPGPETMRLGKGGDGEHQVVRRPNKLVEMRRAELEAIRARRKAMERTDRILGWAAIVSCLAIIITVICF